MVHGERRDSVPRILSIVVVSFLLAGATVYGAIHVSGMVRDSNARPVAGAVVTMSPGGEVSRSDTAGHFTIALPDDAQSLRITHPGYQPLVREIRPGETPVDLAMTLIPLPAYTENVVVSAIRAGAEVPIPRSDLSREEIRALDHGQDVPLLLESTPSMTSYGDAGVGGSGYSYFRLRGIDQTRINMTLDGVPLAESEDMGVYFANFTDLLGSIETIQVQRGVGTSSVGSPSFGGSINFESILLAQDPSLEVNLGGGSFGTRSASAGWQSGFLSYGLALHARLSVNESDGYRDRSGIDQHTAFVSAVRNGDHDSWKLLAFSGREKQQLAFYATDETTLATNPRANDLSEEERDSFGQDFVQVQYQRAFGDAANVAASAYSNRGHGWFRLWDDPVAKTELLEYGLDGRLTGAMVTLNRAGERYSMVSGVHVNRFTRDHTLDGSVGRYYENTGQKDELSGFVKVSRDTGRWHIYGDAQLRHADFQYDGDVAIAPIDWTFFNPKLGARYDVSSAVSLFASVGRSRREPARSDMFAGEDNASVSHDLTAVRPEKVTDYEAGFVWRDRTWTVNANLYAMEFHDEIAATGELSEVGLLLRRNVDRSFRRGIEIDAMWRAHPSLTFRLVSALSHNRIDTWTQYYDVYDAEGGYVESVPRIHENVAPLLTPELVANLNTEIRLHSNATIDLGFRHVASSHLDNTGNDALIAPAYTTLDLGGALQLDRWPGIGQPRLRIQINNLLDADDNYPSGYSYPFLERGEDGHDRVNGIRYFYPMATRNVVAMIEWKLR